jgi:hypothetical protein
MPTALAQTYPPRLLSEPDAAAYLSISPGTLRQLGLRRVVLGRRKLYDRAELDAWVSDLPREDDLKADDAENGDWG